MRLIILMVRIIEYILTMKKRITGLWVALWLMTFFTYWSILLPFFFKLQSLLIKFLCYRWTVKCIYNRWCN